MNDNGTIIYEETGVAAVQNPSVDISSDATVSVALDSEKDVFEGSTIMVSLCPIVDLEKKAPVLDSEGWSSIRWLHFREGRSVRWISREFGLSRKTVAKYIGDDNSPQYKMVKARAKPVADDVRKMVKEILDKDKTAPRKQRHTAKRIYDRLVKENEYSGSDRTIRNLVAELKEKPAKKPSVPLVFEAGKDAQVDFGESYCKIGGRQVKLHGLEVRLNYSRKKFVAYFQSPDTEAFLEGLVRAFHHLGGVPETLSFDNLTIAVSQVLKGKNRVLTKAFKDIQGYYNFKGNFCTPGIDGAHEKGGVEGGIGFSRRNWMVPVPEFNSIEELNDYILQKCIEDESRTVAGQHETIAEAWHREKGTLLEVPGKPFDPGVPHDCTVDGYCTVVLKSNHYSVPAKYVGRALSLKSYWNRVEISDGIETITEHPRSFGKDEYILRPEHYLELLERRPHAILNARPIVQYAWPSGYWELYHQMVDKYGPGEAGREFIRVLKCHVKYGAVLTSAAVAEARTMKIANADVVISIVDRERNKATSPETMDLTNHPILASCKVTIFPDPAQYQLLLEGGAAHDGAGCIA